MYLAHGSLFHHPLLREYDGRSKYEPNFVLQSIFLLRSPFTYEGMPFHAEAPPSHLLKDLRHSSFADGIPIDEGSLCYSAGLGHANPKLQQLLPLIPHNHHVGKLLDQLALDAPLLQAELVVFYLLLQDALSLALHHLNVRLLNPGEEVAFLLAIVPVKWS